MYRNAYAEIEDESGRASRRRERDAFADLVLLLEEAGSTAPDSPKRLEAALALSDHWSGLLEDVLDDANMLPDDVRSGIASIGILMLKEAAAIAEGRARSLDDVVEINRSVMQGLG